MIYKNKEGVTVIQFGEGDVAVGSGRVISRTNKETYPCCMFVEHQLQPKTLMKKNNEVHTMLVFSTPESVDTVMAQLEKAKKSFENKSLLVSG